MSFHVIHFISSLLTFRCTCFRMKSLLWHCSKLCGFGDFRKNLRCIFVFEGKRNQAGFTNRLPWLVKVCLGHLLLGDLKRSWDWGRSRRGQVRPGGRRRSSCCLCFCFVFLFLGFDLLGHSGLNPLLRPPSPLLQQGIKCHNGAAGLSCCKAGHPHLHLSVHLGYFYHFNKVTKKDKFIQLN